MAVRARMSLVEIAKLSWGGTRLKFMPIYDQSIEEDRRFQKATPSGLIEMTVDNPEALAQFELAKHYYVDFTPAPPF